MINTSFRNEIIAEYQSILDFWITHAPDHAGTGFHGQIDNHGRINPDAPRGSVLNARILWAFSAAYRFSGEDRCLDMAARAYHYILDHFIDKKYGGVYWTVHIHGEPLETRKQVYAQAFALYGLSEYYAATGDQSALEQAQNLFRLLEKYSCDPTHGGYFEAFSRDWTATGDIRLSEKDENEKKTGNTHLHILEAYSNLYRVWKDDDLKNALTRLLDLFSNTIIGANGHLLLFFDEEWNPKSQLISYGHDIEAGWLLLDAARVAGDDDRLVNIEKLAVSLTDAALEGMDADGGLWYESTHGIFIREKHWWPQAEALVGMINAWSLTGRQSYYDQAVNTWHFIQTHLIDRKNGEWFWGVHDDYTVMNNDKIGPWKCPYHNARSCLELMRRLP